MPLNKWETSVCLRCYENENKWRLNAVCGDYGTTYWNQTIDDIYSKRSANDLYLYWLCAVVVVVTAASVAGPSAAGVFCGAKSIVKMCIKCFLCFVSHLINADKTSAHFSLFFFFFPVVDSLRQSMLWQLRDININVQLFDIVRVAAAPINHSLCVCVFWSAI